jgi:hypothetical protein
MRTIIRCKILPKGESRKFEGKCHYGLKAVTKRRGVSTLIGIAIFLMICTFIVGYTVTWTQIASTSATAATSEMAFEQQRAAEILSATSQNSTNSNFTIIVYNPTTTPINITQIWNSTSYEWNGAWLVPPLTSINIYNKTSNNGFFTLITARGNVFYITPPSNQTNIYTPKSNWNVAFWATNSSGYTFNLGNTTFNDLSFTVNLVNISFGTNIKQFGFNATTNIIPLYGDTSITVGISLFNPVSPSNPGTNLINVTLTNLSNSSKMSYYFNSSGFYTFTPIDPSKIYDVQIFTNSSTSQTITVTIVGADFD